MLVKGVSVSFNDKTYQLFFKKINPKMFKHPLCTGSITGGITGVPLVLMLSRSQEIRE